MFESILVPVDGSPLAEAALTPAQELRAKFGSRLILLRSVEPVSHRLMQPPGVVEPPAAAAANVELIEKLTEVERQEAQAYLAALRSQLGDEGIETYIADGEPAEAIIAAAVEFGVGLIVMSSHGRGGLNRLVFGSVADAVLRRSNLPVLLIRAQPG